MVLSQLFFFISKVYFDSRSISYESGVRHNSLLLQNDNSDVVKIEAKELTKSRYADFECSMPIVIKNVFDIDNEEWTEVLLERLGDLNVEFDVRRSSDGFVETFEGTLADFVSSLLEESSHEESWYLMSETCLNEDKELSVPLQLPERLFGKDIFQYFPKIIRPRSALIIGGEGARSFLHADPYEWTGWNYLFEGRKLCTYGILQRSCTKRKHFHSFYS